MASCYAQNNNLWLFYARKIHYLLCYFLAIIYITCTPIYTALADDSNITAHEKIAIARHLVTLKKYITWPDTLLKPLSLCSYGTHSLGSALNHVAQQRDDIVLTHITRVDLHHHCNMIYVGSDTPMHDIMALLDQVKQAPVLTISTIPTFTTIGGHITLSDTAQKKLTINIKTLHLSNLRASATLMNIADIAE